MNILSDYRLLSLKGRHARERVVVIANGPSLNYMDLSFLKYETVIGLNKIFLGFNKFGFYPRYYIATNPRVIEQSCLEIKQMNCVKFISRHGAIGHISENALTYLINTKTPPERFCRDISKGAHEGWTVTYVALQLAYFLGFSEVILIGLDHRYEYSGKPNETHIVDTLDHNHFSTNYFAVGQTWDNPDLDKSDESYAIARTEFEKDGRRIIDATVGGACTIFTKQDYRSLFF